MASHLNLPGYIRCFCNANNLPNSGKAIEYRKVSLVPGLQTPDASNSGEVGTLSGRISRYNTKLR